MIPTYNREKYICEAIDSVIAQDYRPIEIIVVDDGSTDNTKEIVAKYDKNIVKYFYQKNKGISGARNTCLAEAKGEYLAWLDSDDYYLPGKLTAQMEYLQKHPDCEIVFTKYENFLENQNLMDNKIAKISIKNDLKDVNKIHLASSLARKSFYKKCGDFPKEFVVSEDVFLVMKANFLGINIEHCLDKVYFKRRIHGTNSLMIHEVSEKDVRNIGVKSIRSAVLNKISKK
jgi:glycosyltransferase involved in cell wall biosynthesis